MSAVISEIDHIIAKQIKDLRVCKGYSLARLADKLDLTWQQVHKYEQGTNRVSAARKTFKNILRNPIQQELIQRIGCLHHALLISLTRQCSGGHQATPHRRKETS